MPSKSNPLPQLIPNRVMKLRTVLASSLWEGRQDLEVVMSPVLDAPITVDLAPKLKYKKVKPGQYFGEPEGEWQQAWFRVEIPAPTPEQVGRRYFFWDCRGETTAYIATGQGRGGPYKPWAGLDVAHPYCILPDRACTLWLDDATYQTCIWYEGAKPIDEYGLRFDGAWIACRNLKNWETYWDLHTLTEWLGYLLRRDGLDGMIKGWGALPDPKKMHPVTRRLVAMLDNAVQGWETGGIDGLAPALKAIFAAFPTEYWQPTIEMIGHSHLDLVWMWPEVEGERKAVHTMATALRLLDEYPQYRFMWTSPHSMQLVAERFPEVYEEIRAKIAGGQWEATGAPWVEFDTLIACGEALGRSLVLGQNLFQKLKGAPSTTLWLPDCFGFNAFLPQIMALTGVQNFYTTKLSWSIVTEFPYDSFVWRSPDGSEVITHLDVPGEGWDSLNGIVTSTNRYRQLDVHNEILKGTGVGDGGGGTTVDKIEMYNRLGNLSQVPPVRWGKVEGFFERLGESRSQLPVFEGELYLEYHRGIYTTQSEFKRRYRRLERALQAWEAASVMAGFGPIPTHPWERLSFVQFHDSLPGSSIKLVYDQLGAELEELGSQALESARRNLCEECAAEEEGALNVFNPIALDRQVVVELSSPDGVQGPLQQTVGQDGGAVWLASASLPALSAGAIRPVQAAWEVSPRVLDNGRLRVEFDENGSWVKAAGKGDGQGQAAWPLADAPRFLLHPDYPPLFDAWEIDHNATRSSVDEVAGLPLRVVESGPVRAVLAGETRLGKESSLEVRYILEAGSDVLKIEAVVDWKEEHRLLRFYLPTTLRGRNALYGAPYGSVARPQAPGGPREEAMWEVPASRWAAVTDAPGWDGLAIVSEAKYGFSCRDGELALTLLRAPIDPGAEWPQNPRRHKPTHALELGRHTLRFAVGRYQARTENGVLSTPAQAEALYAPVLTGAFGERPAPFRFTSPLGTVTPTWVLPSGEGRGYILRLNETLGASGTLSLAFQQPPTFLSAVDFMERPVQGVDIRAAGGGTYQITYRPYQVISLLVV